MTGDDAPPAERGEWEPVEHRFHHLPVHLALLHTGTVLAFGGSGNDETRLDDPYPAELFDPRDGTVAVVDPPQVSGSRSYQRLWSPSSVTRASTP